jgi:hypothetical protein
MKKHFLPAAIAVVATQSACSTQYRIEMDPDVFLATWNRDMNGPDMPLHRHQVDGDAQLVSEHWLLVTQNTRANSWTLTAPEAGAAASSTRTYSLADLTDSRTRGQRRHRWRFPSQGQRNRQTHPQH